MNEETVGTVYRAILRAALCEHCYGRMTHAVLADKGARVRLEFCPHRSTLATLYLSEGGTVGHINVDGPVAYAEVERRAKQLGGDDGGNVTTVATGGGPMH